MTKKIKLVVFVVVFQFYWHFLRWVVGQNTQAQNTQTQNTQSPKIPKAKILKVPKYPSIEVFWVLLMLRRF